MPVPIKARVEGGFFNQVQMGSKTFLKNVMGPESNARWNLRRRVKVGR
jgi:hypothetical protein